MKKSLKNFNGGKTEKEVDELLAKPMSDDIIKRYLPKNANIYKYNELKKFNSIDELMPDENPYCVILYLNDVSSGHWVGLSKYKPVVEVFCSYGTPLDGQLKWHTKEENKALGIDRPYLTDLIKKSKYKVKCNRVDYQNENNTDIATCGRHCCWRLLNLLGKGLDLPEYHKMMKNLKKDSDGESYDEIVCRLIDL